MLENINILKFYKYLLLISLAFILSFCAISNKEIDHTALSPDRCYAEA